MIGGTRKTFLGMDDLMSPLTSVAMKTEAQSNRQAIEQASRYLAKGIGTMGRLLLAITLGVTLVGEATAGFQGNAAPPPHCVISDPDPPTNVRTRANGVIIGTLANGDTVRIIDQVRAYDGLWDFVVELSTSIDQEQPSGWVYDPLIRCR
jgi:hypothetical protein